MEPIKSSAFFDKILMDQIWNLVELPHCTYPSVLLRKHECKQKHVAVPEDSRQGIDHQNIIDRRGKMSRIPRM